MTDDPKKPVPTKGVPITDPAFVPERDADGIVINDPDCLPVPEGAKWVRRSDRLAAKRASSG